MATSVAAEENNISCATILIMIKYSYIQVIEPASLPFAWHKAIANHFYDLLYFSDTGEQMAVGVTILLSMAVFFLLLEDKMPETSDVVPLLGKYFACSILQISLAVGATCMMLCFHHHDATEVPTWMKV